MSYYQKAKDLYDMMDKGQLMEAFEKHYAENCVIRENPTGEVREGKEAQRKAIENWQASIEEYHGSGYNNITADEENRVTMVESWTDVTMKNGMRMNMSEVAVQKWNEEGQIENEQFYFQMGPPPKMEW